MSSSNYRIRRVPPSRSEVRAAISVREVERDLVRFRPATAAIARAVFWEA